MSTQTFVSELPKCDFCDEQARYDGKTVMGPWANMCVLHFGQYGTGLGTGRGQELVVKPIVATDVAFRDWMQKVNAGVEHSVGMSCHDLPDAYYRDWFETGMSASAAASEVVADAMDEIGLSW